MKESYVETISRMHIAINVDSMDQSREFYSKLLGHKPTQVSEDQIDWVLDNPATHLSIFHNANLPKGVEHIGIDYDEMNLLKARNRMQTADTAVIDPNGIKVELYSKPRLMQNPYKTGITINMR